MQFRTLKQAQDYIFSFIPKENNSLFPGELGLKRVKYLLSLLGNPQEKQKTIHIAGTSGKGSTAYFTAVLLRNYGFTVGLIVKPHLADMRERYMINNKLITEKDFCRYVSMIIPAVDKTLSSKYGAPTYAEINAALAFVIFADKKVDYAVVETYLGGLFDCTNVINRGDKLVVLTRIGFDHTKILGQKLREIAGQKAGIIHKQNPVIALWQLPQVRNVFNTAVHKNNSCLIFVKKGKHFRNIKQTRTGTSFDFSAPVYKGHELREIKKLQLGMAGLFHAENASLALTAVIFLAKRDKFLIREPQIRSELANAYFPGRMDIKSVMGKTVIIDGAHNPQKMRAFLSSLRDLYPRTKFHFLIAFMQGKDSRKMLSQIKLLAEHITISTFFAENQDWIRKAEKPEKITDYLRETGYSNYDIRTDVAKAYTSAFKKAKDILIVTGSQYFISEVYKNLGINNK